MMIAVYGKVRGVKGHQVRVVDPIEFVEAWGPYAEAVMMGSADDPYINGVYMVWTEIVVEEN